MIKIVICIKAVKSKYAFSEDTAVDQFVMNPYDMYALEQIIELKKKADIHLICLCMGNNFAKEILIRSIAMGANEGVLLCDEKFAGSDTYVTSLVISEALKRLEYDFVVCGKQAVDGETGQVSFGISTRLNMYCLNHVKKLEVENNCLIATYLSDKNIITAKCHGNILFVFNEYTLKPGKISLCSLKKANNTKIQIMDAKALTLTNNEVGSKGSKTKIIDSINITMNNTNIQWIQGDVIHITDYLEKELSENL